MTDSANDSLSTSTKASEKSTLPQGTGVFLDDGTFFTLTEEEPPY
ncbi:hypothetical protein [Heliorestis acidaminivorans]|nr:hypothetical protein [Heliorestis acidaminivorans]